MLRYFILVLFSGIVFGCGEENITNVTEVHYDGTFHVRDFGAIGNGKTDDTRTIQAAIDSAFAIGGTIVFFDPGIYLTTGLVAKTNVTLRGASLFSTTISASCRGINILKNEDDVSNFSVEDLAFRGSNSKEVVERGVFLRTTSRVTIRNCLFYNITYAIHAFNSHYIQILDCRFENIPGLNGPDGGYGYAVLFEGGAWNQVSRSIFINVKRHAIYLSAGCSHSTIDANTINVCRNIPIQIYSTFDQEPCTTNLITANAISNVIQELPNQAHGIVLLGNVIDNVVSDNIISAPPETGIKCEGSALTDTARPRQNLMTGNSIRSSGVDGILLLNADDNIILSNDISRARRNGILVETHLEERPGNYSRRNTLLSNRTTGCALAGISISTNRCINNIVVGNVSVAEEVPFLDVGTGTVYRP